MCSSDLAAGIIYHPLDVLANRQQETKMSATMESYLKGLKDPRIGSYFTKVQNGEYNGLRIGIPIYAQIEKGSTAVVDKSDMVKKWLLLKYSFSGQKVLLMDGICKELLRSYIIKV